MFRIVSVRERLFSLQLLAVFASAASAQSPVAQSVAPPQQAETLHQQASPWDTVGHLLAASVKKKEIAGAVALVIYRGQRVVDNTIGFQDKEAALPMCHDTIFRIASMTKPVTSTAVMMLREEGLLKLSDPVAKYLPEFSEMRVLVAFQEKLADTSPEKLDSAQNGKVHTRPAQRPITIQNLLTHTSGIGYGFFVGPLYQEAGVSDGLVQTHGTLAEGVQRLARLPLLHQPGTTFEYGLSTDVLGRLVEVVSGEPLDQFFEQRIFAPLGMKDTSFFLPPSRRSRLATLYEPDRKGGIRPAGDGLLQRGMTLYSGSYHYLGPKTYFSGGAGLVSTVEDYARFLQMMLQRGELDGIRVLQEKTVRQMTSHQIGDLRGFPHHGDGFGYGFGVLTERGRAKKGWPKQNGASIGAYSWAGFFHTYFWVDPNRELIAILMTQLRPHEISLQADFQAAVYKALATQ